MLKYLTAGESHGPQLTAILDGFPAGFKISLKDINYQLNRRQKGFGRGGRMQIEQDEAEILSGVRNSLTLGGPITFVIRNKDWDNWRKIMDPLHPVADDLSDEEKRLAYDITVPRPGHADLTGGIKWHHHDLRNVLERASARETAARVAVGSLTRQFLEYFNVELVSHVVRIGNVVLGDIPYRKDIEKIKKLSEQSEVRCIDKDIGQKMIEAIKQAMENKDSLGGIVEIIVRGLPAGLGGFSQWSDRLDGRLTGTLMAVHSVKGVEIGLGFTSAEMKGSEIQDEIFFDPYGNPAKKKFHRETNHAGGIEGGITNGEDIILRVAAKPVVCEAVTALVLAEAFMNKFGSDNMTEIERNHQTFLNTIY